MLITDPKVALQFQRLQDKVSDINKITKSCVPINLGIILKSCPVDATTSANSRCSTRLRIVRLILLEINLNLFFNN